MSLNLGILVVHLENLVRFSDIHTLEPVLLIKKLMKSDVVKKNQKA